jgi:hypothetical protein
VRKDVVFVLLQQEKGLRRVVVLCNNGSRIEESESESIKDSQGQSGIAASPSTDWSL